MKNYKEQRAYFGKINEYIKNNHFSSVEHRKHCTSSVKKRRTTTTTLLFNVTMKKIM